MVELNLSINNQYLDNAITKECFTWCKGQHLINANNINIQALIIIIVAAIALIIYITYIWFKDYTNLDHTTIKIIKMLPEFAFYLIMGYIVYALYLLRNG